MVENNYCDGCGAKAARRDVARRYRGIKAGALQRHAAGISIEEIAKELKRKPQNDPRMGKQRMKRDPIKVILSDTVRHIEGTYRDDDNSRGFA